MISLRWSLPYSTCKWKCGNDENWKSAGHNRPPMISAIFHWFIISRPADDSDRVESIYSNNFKEHSETTQNDKTFPAFLAISLSQSIHELPVKDPTQRESVGDQRIKSACIYRNLIITENTGNRRECRKFGRSAKKWSCFISIMANIDLNEGEATYKTHSARAFAPHAKLALLDLRRSSDDWLILIFQNEHIGLF